ncbi:MAG TPA: sialidase family protein [Chitinophagaceae bacterium]|nr:sialidase family protein [Chitinophagaceae bacterium]
MKRIFMPSILLVMLASCGTVRYMQPNVPNGGRAVSVSRHPSNNDVLVVASESGGIFKSVNSGTNWNRVSGSTTFWFNCIRYSNANPNTVIAVANADTKVSNGGGIWRSADGGNSWSHISLTPPAPSCPSDFGAFCIDIEPGTNRIWVGTSCGLAFSNDDGVNWNFISAVSGYNNQKVYAVLAPSANNLKILTDAGVRISTDGGNNWTVSNTGLPGYVAKGVHNQIACSPYNDQHIFWAFNFWGSDNQWHIGLYVSSNNGTSWTSLSDNPGINRPPFVRVAKSLSGNPNQIDVYMSDGGCNFKRATFNDASLNIVGSWANLIVDHCDCADLCFKADGKTPLILASDGGLHKTTNNGATWTFTGGGSGGYNALQITELTGQLHSGDANADLYFATQDNNIWGSPDNGATWPNTVCCEGFFLNIPRNSLAATDTKLTGVDCGPCFNFISGPLLAGFSGFSNPPNDAGNPKLLKPANYIQSTSLSGIPGSIFVLTNNTGSSWTSRYGFPEGIMDLPKSVGNINNPVVYTAIRAAGTTADGQQMIGIRKAVDVLGTGTPVVSNVTGFGCLGIFPTMFAWYKPFGPDLFDPNHIIVPDIIDENVKITTDGGATWSVDSTLTNLVTNAGIFKFRWGPFTQISTIAFDPDNKGHILVGTVQSGAIRSCDNGRTWSKIIGTEAYPSISSFFFLKNNQVGVSSYGRGLFKLNLKPCPKIVIKPPRIYQLEVPLIYYMGVLIPLKDIHNPDVCPRCGYFFVQNGDIRSYTQNKETGEIEEVFISGGKITGYSYNGSPKQNEFRITTSDKTQDFSRDNTLSDLLAKNYKIKGLYLEGNLFKGLILSPKDLTEEHVPKQKKAGPSIYAILQTKDANKAASPSLIINGIGFERELPLELTVDGNRIELTERPKYDEKGNFQLTVTIPLTIGIHQISISQKTNTGVIKEVTIINVPAQDYRKEQQ